MKLLTRSTRISAVIAVCMFATVSALGQARYVSPDKSFSVQYPTGWSVSEVGGRLHVSTPDKAVYSLYRDALVSPPKADLTNDSALKTDSQSRAQTLLNEIRFDNTRTFTVPNGSGVVYRYRGVSAANGRTALVDVYYAVIGKHNIIVAPETALQPDHSDELQTLIASSAFPTDKPAVKSRSTVIADTTKAAITPTPKEFERYEGKIQKTDTSFVLRLYHDNSAKLDWTPAGVQTTHWSGTYTGQDYAYDVTLTQDSGSNPLSAKKLNLYLRPYGANETGDYNTDNLTTKRAIADVRLTQVEGGESTVKAASATDNKKNAAAAKRASRAVNRANRNRTRTRMPNRSRVYRGPRYYNVTPQPMIIRPRL